MKLSFNKDNLMNGINIVLKAVSSKTTMPILECILIDAQGQATDISIHANHILRVKDKLNQILSERTGQPLDVVKRDTERDNFMTAQEALEYGLIDKVIEHR